MPEGLFEKPVAATGRFVRIVPERGIDAPQGLTYAIPPGLEDLQVGERIRAPLGRSGRAVEGWVVEILPDGAELGVALERIKPLLGRAGRKSRSKAAANARSLTAPGTRFPPSLMQLTTWIAQYYCCPIGTVLATMVPAAVRRERGSRAIVLLARAADAPGEVVEGLKSSARKAWEQIAALPSVEFPARPDALVARLRLRNRGALNRLVEAELLTPVQRSEVRAAGGRFESEEAIEEAARQRITLSAAQRTVGDAIVESLGAFHVHLLRGVTGSGKTEVYLRVLERVIERGQGAIVLVPEISLTPQTAARFIARFRDRPEVGVAVLHSGLSASQRHDQWARIATGRARIVVGARSAVFAPFPDAPEKPGALPRSTLGLIVVDEEHDHSYKQDSAPRYHARDVALRRAQIEGLPVLLGSATPSLESWHNSLTRAEGGAARFSLHELPERVGGGRLPRVKIVDLVEEERRRASGPPDPSGSRRLRSIGPTLEGEIRRTIEAPGGGQIILLLNRRGYASYICCPDQRCGWFMTCEHCDVTVVFHRVKGPGTGDRASAGRDLGPGTRHQESTRSLLSIVRCHHCLAEQKLPAVCPVCSKRVNTFGFGTQRLEEEIEAVFPSLRMGHNVLRLDSDVMQRASDYLDALERFRRGEVRVLLGTQMIAKGLDFPGVELIGVINADTALNLPDFRASERTFQLVSQVAGRAGRSEKTGRIARVIVQSLSPRTPAITLAAAHDYPGFARQEMEVRRSAGLPPIGRMARIVCRDKDGAKAEARAAELVFALREFSEAGKSLAASMKRQRQGQTNPAALRIRGPMPCPISRIAGRYRYAVEIMAPSPGPIQAALADLRRRGLVKSDEKTEVDVDPLALL